MSLKDQEEKLLTYCKLQGLDPVHVIREEGTSAGKPLATRPGGQAILQLLKRGEVGHVIPLNLAGFSEMQQTRL